MHHLLTPTLLLDAAPAADDTLSWLLEKAWEVGKAAVPFIIFFVARRTKKGDDDQEKKVRTETDAATELKSLRAAVDLLKEQNTRHSQHYEEVKEDSRKCNERVDRIKELATENKTKIESVKDGLGRIESQLSTLLGNLLNRPHT